MKEPVIPVLMMVAGGVLIYAAYKDMQPQTVIKTLLTGGTFPAAKKVATETTADTAVTTAASTLVLT